MIDPQEQNEETFDFSDLVERVEEMTEEDLDQMNIPFVTQTMVDEEGEEVEVHVLKLEIPQPYAPEMNEVLEGTLDLVRYLIDRGEGSEAIVPVPEGVEEKMVRLYSFDEVEPTVYRNMEVWATDMLPDGGLFVKYWERAYIVSLPHILFSVEKEKEEQGRVAVPWPEYPDGWYHLWKPEEMGEDGDGEGEGKPSMNEFVTHVREGRVANGGGVRVIDFFLPPAPSGWEVERVWVLTERQREAVQRHVGVTLGSIEEYGETGIPPEFIADLRAIEEALE